MQTFNDIPALGLGTYGRTGAEGLKAILAALEIGYRHIDTAQTYDTEANVGEALRRSGLPRTRCLHHNQGCANKARAEGLSPEPPRQPRYAWCGHGRPRLDPLAFGGPSSPARGLRGIARNGEAAGARAPDRRVEFSQRAPGACRNGTRQGRSSPPIRSRCIPSCRTEKCWSAVASTVLRSPPTCRSPKAASSATRSSAGSARSARREP